MKPRVFVVAGPCIEINSHTGDFVLIKQKIRMCLEHVNGPVPNFTGDTILAREVIPIDWDKIWTHFGSTLVGLMALQEEIQKQVEKQLNGEE